MSQKQVLIFDMYETLVINTNDLWIPTFNTIVDGLLARIDAAQRDTIGKSYFDVCIRSYSFRLGIFMFAYSRWLGCK